MLENVAGQFVAKRRSHKCCSDADRARAKEYREKNKAATIERNRIWREENKDYIRAWSKDKYERFKVQWAKSSNERHRADPRRRLFTAAKGRAKKRGIEFSITKNDVIVPEFCPITKLKLEFVGGTFTPSSPTLDRVNNDLGYVKGNVRVISYKANSYKGDMTIHEIERMALYVRGEI